MLKNLSVLADSDKSGTRAVYVEGADDKTSSHSQIWSEGRCGFGELEIIEIAKWVVKGRWLGVLSPRFSITGPQALGNIASRVEPHYDKCH